MKFTRILFIILIVLAGFFGLVVWFAGQVSAVYDPLKTYSYSLTPDDLKEKLTQTIKSNPNYSFKITLIAGTDKNDLSYHADILIKTGTEDYEFNIICEKENSSGDNNVKSKISLIGAFDNVHMTGGYKPEDTDVEKLISIFETQIINRLGTNTSR